MKNMKQKLLELAQSWNASGQYDDTEFARRFIISDTDLDEFANDHGLAEDEMFDKEQIEKACDCKIVHDYEGKNQNAQFGECEIIFNPEKQLYIVASGIWGEHGNPSDTRASFSDYIENCLDSWDVETMVDLEIMFEHDDDRTTYEALKQIADKEPNWFTVSDYSNYKISSSVYLTEDQAKELEEVFYLELMSELLGECQEND